VAAYPTAGAARLRKLLGGSRGSILLETVIATMVFALAGTAVLSGLSVMHNTGAMVEGHSVAEILARNQMEHVFTLPYQSAPATYTSIAVPPGYSVTAVAVDLVAGAPDPDVEKVVVTAGRGGENILTLETVRAKP
jgi:hypothetical protein